MDDNLKKAANILRGHKAFMQRDKAKRTGYPTQNTPNLELKVSKVRDLKVLRTYKSCVTSNYLTAQLSPSLQARFYIEGNLEFYKYGQFHYDVCAGTYKLEGYGYLVTQATSIENIILLSKRLYLGTHRSL